MMSLVSLALSKSVYFQSVVKLFYTRLLRQVKLLAPILHYDPRDEGMGLGPQDWLEILIWGPGRPRHSRRGGILRVA